MYKVKGGDSLYLKAREGEEPMRIDYHVHAMAHGEYEYNPQWINQYLEFAYIKGLKEIGFSEHDEFAAQVDGKLSQETQIARPHGIDIRWGIEVDYIPGQEDRINDIIAQQEYDYVIGSVHYIDGWGFDHPDSRMDFDDRDIDEIYSQYAGILMQMAQSGYVDVVGHIDLVKIWGHRPRHKTTLYYLDPVLRAIKKYNLAIEINSAGLRKPVAEIYPATDILDRMYAYSIPITFGSDAHHPEQLGEGLEKAYHVAWQAGYRYLTRFIRHEKMITAIEL